MDRHRHTVSPLVALLGVAAAVAALAAFVRGPSRPPQRRWSD